MVTTSITWGLGPLNISYFICIMKTIHVSEVDLRIKYGICKMLCIYFMASRKVKSSNSGRFISLAPKSLWTVTVAMKLKDTCSLKGKL